ncbi:MAG: hypothetical protein JKY93_02180 [Gammaproteobacteria bacterium]|nr:hypothetical protein [Gammaproteobacteria bacterium]
MGDRILLANGLLYAWCWARCNPDIRKLGYDDMSPQEKLNHVRGGGVSEVTKEESAIGSFMYRQPKIDKQIASYLWGVNVYDSDSQMYAAINHHLGWSRGKVERFKDYLLKKVAREVVV